MELEARGIHARGVLAGIDLAIGRGERIAIMGPPGAGKSTLALVLAGLVTPDAGVVSGAAAGTVRAVLQRPESALLTERVDEEIALAALWRGASRDEASQAARRLIDELGLPADVARRDPLTLSGGEQRRVAIAAALATDPRVLVLDEPGAGLDPPARRALHVALAQLAAAGRAIVTITHDPAEAARVADRLVVVHAGRIVSDGPIDAVLGDPHAAQQLGLLVAPEVALATGIARSRGVDVAPVAHPDIALRLAAELLPRPVVAVSPGTAAASVNAPAAASPSPVDVRPQLPRLVDARVRLFAAVAAAVAALVANSLVAAGIVVFALAITIALSHVDRRQVRSVVRPLLVLAALLVAVQHLFGSNVSVPLVAGDERVSATLVALHRALQIAGIMLVALLVTAKTATADLAAALRRLLAPLRLLRVPVDDVALVTASGLGLVPAMADELDRIRMARHARGIDTRGHGIVARLRSETQLLMPLLVTSFRRASLLADAIAARGVDVRRRPVEWRPRHVPMTDVLLLASGMILVLVAVFV